ncbi:hypothetical protein [Pedobacter sp.]|uniref:hypothetical protein n=1 Tax=Pedobacter sp. TaxID=1411316 RepID=UPI003D7FC1F3
MKKLLLLTLSIGLLWSCKSTENQAKFTGTFKGKFITGTPGATTATESQLTFNQSNYTSTKGSGTFKVLDKKVINFADENMWTANFDWNTILKGDYTYEVKGDSLILNKTAVTDAIYQYRLGLQK